MRNADRKHPKPQPVRAARTAAGLTQAEAAARVQVSLQAWQEWEAGNRRMPPGLWDLVRLKIEQ
jgi:putative transcriptional regulator